MSRYPVTYKAGAAVEVDEIIYGFAHRDAVARVTGREVLPDGRIILNLNLGYEGRHIASVDLVAQPDERIRVGAPPQAGQSPARE